jgi:protein ImuA
MRNNAPGSDNGNCVSLAGVEDRAGGPTGKVLIEQLRTSIRALEQVPVSLATPPAPGAALPRPACSLSLVSEPLASPSLVSQALVPNDNGNRDLPLNRLKQGGLHELKPQAYRDSPAALGFALSVMAEAVQTRTSAHHRGLVLWCLTRQAAREWGHPYGPGLLRAGLDPARLLIVEARTAEDAAWALEEGLKSGALIASLGQVDIKTPLAARRLGLAAQASRTPCLLLSSHGGTDLEGPDFSGSPGTGLPGTLTRWRIATEPSNPAPFDTAAPGAAAWRLTLERCRGSAPGRRFRMEFSYESDRLHVAAPSCDRAAEAGENSKRRYASAG